MSARSYPIARFRLGRITTTPNAMSRLTNGDILLAIQRHQAGDWGNVSKQDHEANEHALAARKRLMSVYHSAAGLKFWLITEADRSSTCILMPEDY